MKQVYVQFTYYFTTRRRHHMGRSFPSRLSGDRPLESVIRRKECRRWAGFHVRIICRSRVLSPERLFDELPICE